MKSCRYDHLVTAIEALKKYADSCADRHDTLGIIGIAHGAVHALEGLESGLKKRGKARKAASLSLMAEYEEKRSALSRAIKDAENFLEANEKRMDAIMKVYETFDQVREMKTAMISLRRKLDKHHSDLQKPV